MTTNAAVSITAEEALPADGHDSDHTSKVFALGFDRVQVSFPAEDGYEPTCKHCGEVIEQQDDGQWFAGSTICTSHPNYDDPMEASAPHEPETGPGTWCNSASVSVDEEDDAVHVSISVGDPRGAFVMTVRKVDRSGYCKHCGKPIERHSLGHFFHDVEHPSRTCRAKVGWRTTEAEPDGERYMLHVPYEGMGFEHMPLKKLSEGTFLVG